MAFDAISFDLGLPFGPAGESGTTPPRRRGGVDLDELALRTVFGVPVTYPAVGGGIVQSRQGDFYYVPDAQSDSAYRVGIYDTGHIGSHDRPERAFVVESGPQAGDAVRKWLVGDNALERALKAPYRIATSVFTKEFWSEAWDVLQDWPGLTGFAFGLVLPFAPISWTWKLGISAAVGVGGYVAPAESWFRRFSIGAGVGGGIAAGYQLYQMIPSWSDVAQGAFEDLFIIDPTDEYVSWWGAFRE